VIPEDVRRYAEDPGAWGPDLPPESGLTRILERLGFEPVAELEILVDPELP
jgi:hypothetical protein